MRWTTRGKCIACNCAVRIYKRRHDVSLVQLRCRGAIEGNEPDTRMDVKKGAKVVRDRLIPDLSIKASRPPARIVGGRPRIRCCNDLPRGILRVGVVLLAGATTAQASFREPGPEPLRGSMPLGAPSQKDGGGASCRRVVRGCLLLEDRGS